MPIPDDIVDGSELLQLLKSAGLNEKPCSAMVIAPPGDEERITDLFSSLGKVLTLERPQAGEVRGPFRISGKLDKPYFQAIAKIGFHYVLKHAPNLHGYEPEFVGIRDFILSGLGSVEQFVNIFPGPLAGEPSPNEGHLLTMEAEYGKPVLAKMQFFRSPTNEPVAWVVNLGQNPSPIDWSNFRGHWYYYDGKSATGFDGGVQELTYAKRMTCGVR